MIIKMVNTLGLYMKSGLAPSMWSPTNSVWSLTNSVRNPCISRGSVRSPTNSMQSPCSSHRYVRNSWGSVKYCQKPVGNQSETSRKPVGNQSEPVGNQSEIRLQLGTDRNPTGSDRNQWGTVKYCIGRGCQRGCQSGCTDHTGTLEGNGENSKIEVSAHELYEFESRSDFMSMITVLPLKTKKETIEEHVAATIVVPLTKEGHSEEMEARDNRKFWFKSTGKRRVRPVVKPEEKECLVTWVKVRELEAWTLWDSGSTMSGITPTFAEIKILLDTLEDPHILQLGTVGSRSIIKYGADVEIKVADLAFTSYVDVANFDRYDMIIGTPLLRK